MPTSRWSLPFGLSLLLAAAGACQGGSDTTAVRVRVQYDATWQLDALRIEANDREKESPAATEVTLLVPDDWAGQAVPIQLWGLRGGEVGAHGGAEAVPERGREVAVDLIMTRVPCGAWCTPGATTCTGDGVSTCQEREQDACLEWSEPVACGADAPYCSLGECRAECVDECADGETRCDGPGASRACGQGDSDPCLDWLPAEGCPSERPCSSGACRAVCEDECGPSEATCQGDAAASCADFDGDGCTQWGPPAPCAGGSVCDEGACGEACTDQCAGDTCDGPFYRACGQYDFDQCADLSAGTSCVPDDLCLEGLCTSEGCASTDRSCDQPPAPECVDDDTMRVYQPAGACVAEAGCEYEYDDVACARCPDCDLCDSITCDDPPAPACIDPITLRAHQSPGTCDDGTCRYEQTDSACPDGCAAGACNQIVFDGGGDHTCAIVADGSMVCWGQNDAGEATPPAGTYRMVSAGARHTCAIRTDGTVACFGENVEGQATPPAGTFISVSAGTTHSCGLRTDGAVVCWGLKGSEQTMPPAGEFSAISVGVSYSCGLKTDGTVACWGPGAAGQMPPPSGTFSSISAGGVHACGLRTDGTVACWGEDNEGQAPPPTGTFLSVSAGGFHSCGLRPEGTVVCWGRNVEGQIEAPAGVFAVINAGARHNCGIQIDGAMVCWGDDDFGQSTPPSL